MMTHDTATPVELIRIGDLARLTGLSVSHLRRLADAGLIPSTVAADRAITGVFPGTSPSSASASSST
jgi:hypothetical protein